MDIYVPIDRTVKVDLLVAYLCNESINRLKEDYNHDSEE